jgi:mRNA interferase MazF
MSSTTTYKAGQVLVVEVPFSDGSGSKPRPAVVVSVETFHQGLPDVIVCPISSQPRYYVSPKNGDCPLKSWNSIGLQHPSTVRVSKVLAIDKEVVQRVLGRLSRDDFRDVRAVIRKAFGL